MNRAGGRLLLWCIGTVWLVALITLAKGGLYIDRHEGDTLHLIEILRRMGLGQWPHQDFSTPLGVLAFLPMSVFVQAGFGVGHAILLGQIFFAMLFVLPVWWVAHTRLQGSSAYVLSAGLLLMMLALVHGEVESNVSVSMHYNRWAWALAYVAVISAALPPKRLELQWVDGVTIGAAMSFFILGKVTYAVAFAPGLLLALALRRQWRAMIVGVFVVLVMFGVSLAFGGVSFWQAYIGDLMSVQSSTIRPRAGEDFASLILGPRFLVANLLLACGIYFLRRSENPNLGLVLAVLAPGFIYVTYQNWGNDPKWLGLLAVLLFIGGRQRRTRILAVLAAILIAPSFLNMAFSPLRHVLLKTEKFQPVFQAAPHDDVLTPTARVVRVQERRPAQFSDPAFATLNGTAEQADPVSFKGEIFAECRQELGLLGIMQAVADDLEAAGLTGEDKVFTADTFGGFWMFGNLAPADGAAPWYYGNLTGFADAGYVLLPLCPGTPRAFKSVIADLETHAMSLQEVRRTELYVLYEKSEG